MTNTNDRDMADRHNAASAALVELRRAPAPPMGALVGQVMKWLDAHREAVLTLVAYYGDEQAAERLSLMPSDLNNWVSAEQLKRKPARSVASNGAETASPAPPAASPAVGRAEAAPERLAPHAAPEGPTDSIAIQRLKAALPPVGPPGRAWMDQHAEDLRAAAAQLGNYYRVARALGGKNPADITTWDQARRRRDSDTTWSRRRAAPANPAPPSNPAQSSSNELDPSAEATLRRLQPVDDPIISEALANMGNERAGPDTPLARLQKDAAAVRMRGHKLTFDWLDAHAADVLAARDEVGTLRRLAALVGGGLMPDALSKWQNQRGHHAPSGLGPPGQPERANAVSKLPRVLLELVARLPPDGSVFPPALRQAWLNSASELFVLVYRAEEGKGA